MSKCPLCTGPVLETRGLGSRDGVPALVVVYRCQNRGCALWMYDITNINADGDEVARMARINRAVQARKNRIAQHMDKLKKGGK